MAGNIAMYIRVACLNVTTGVVAAVELPRRPHSCRSPHKLCDLEMPTRADGPFGAMDTLSLDASSGREGSFAATCFSHWSTLATSTSGSDIVGLQGSLTELLQYGRTGGSLALLSIRGVKGIERLVTPCDLFNSPEFSPVLFNVSIGDF